MSKWIVAFGDSFTYGDELPDDLLASGNIWFDKILKKARKQWPHVTNRIYAERNQWIRDNVSDYDRLCHDMSYVNSTAFKLGIGSENRAGKGKSIQNMLIDIIEYFEYREPSNEIFVVGLGLGSRQTRFDSIEEQYRSENWRFLIDVSNPQPSATEEYIFDNFLNTDHQNLIFEVCARKIKHILATKGVPHYIFDANKRLEEITVNYNIKRCAYGHPGPEAHNILSEQVAEEVNKLL
jgi:hypothetical protein